MRVETVEKCSACRHRDHTGMLGDDPKWVCRKSNNREIHAVSVTGDLPIPNWCPLQPAEYMYTKYMESAQVLIEWVCDTFHRHVTGAKVTDLSHEVDIILDSTGWAEVRRRFRDIATLQIMGEAYAMIEADEKALKRIGCHDWGFTPWFAENCIVFKDSSEHFLCVTPDWKTRVENYILEAQSHDEND